MSNAVGSIIAIVEFLSLGLAIEFVMFHSNPMLCILVQRKILVHSKHHFIHCQTVEESQFTRIIETRHRLLKRGLWHEVILNV